MIVIDGVEVGRCVTVREAAQRLGTSEESARKRLKMLERRGVVEKKLVGRVAIYCVKEGAQLPLPPLPFKRPGPGEKTRRRMEKALEFVAREGCVTTSALRMALNVGYSQVKHVMQYLLAEGRIVEVVVGKTALWCRDREAAEELIAKLREAAHRLASRGRYITPSRLLQMVRRDKEAYALFTKFVKLSRIDGGYINPVALAFADSVLASLYGEPMRRMRRKTVYVVSQPRQLEISTRNGADKETVRVNVPDDLAAALEGVNVDEVVYQALEQLLQKYRI